MVANGTGTVQVTWRGGDRFDITARTHTVGTDQPLDGGGTDTAPTPVELFVGSLAACVAFYAERYLKRRRLPAGVAVTARYEMGVRPARVARVELTVEAHGLPEELRDSFTSVIRHCTVHNTLHMPPQVDIEVRTAVPAPA